MTSITPAQAFAKLSSAMVGKHDIAGTLSDLLRNCAELVSADAAGILIADGDAGLQLLGATSHSVSELELYQTQIEQGPCVEAWTRDETISVAGTQRILDRWEIFGPSMIEAGFASVHAAPIHWHDRPLGTLNIFRVAPTMLTEEERTLSRAFADLATILIVHSDDPSTDIALARARNALTSRTLIEQAKGVLSHQLGLDMASAYTRLHDMSQAAGTNLTEAAEAVVRAAQRRGFSPQV